MFRRRAEILRSHWVVWIIDETFLAARKSSNWKELFINSIAFFLPEVHRTAAHRPECLHSHRDRRAHVLPRIPRLLWRNSRVTVHALAGELIWSLLGDVSTFDIFVNHRPWHFSIFRKSLLCKFSIRRASGQNLIVEIFSRSTRQSRFYDPDRLASDPLPRNLMRLTRVQVQLTAKP